VRIAVDTNVLVRYLTWDDEAEAIAAARAIEGADAMNTVLTTKATNDWVEVLEAAGVPSGTVYDYAQMFADPQVRHRSLVQYARPRTGWFGCPERPLAAAHQAVCESNATASVAITRPRIGSVSPQYLSVARACCCTYSRSTRLILVW
jgi:crotonobetainyl-CoA:carnitine CoA-transferase CaiB-like acyl-CoA transferase